MTLYLQAVLGFVAGGIAAIFVHMLLGRVGGPEYTVYRALRRATKKLRGRTGPLRRLAFFMIDLRIFLRKEGSSKEALAFLPTGPLLFSINRLAWHLFGESLIDDDPSFLLEQMYSSMTKYRYSIRDGDIPGMYARFRDFFICANCFYPEDGNLKLPELFPDPHAKGGFCNALMGVADRMEETGHFLDLIEFLGENSCSFSTEPERAPDPDILFASTLLSRTVSLIRYLGPTSLGPSALNKNRKMAERVRELARSLQHDDQTGLYKSVLALSSIVIDEVVQVE